MAVFKVDRDIFTDFLDAAAGKQFPRNLDPHQLGRVDAPVDAYSSSMYRVTGTVGKADGIDRAVFRAMEAAPSDVVETVWLLQVTQPQPECQNASGLEMGVLNVGRPVSSRPRNS
jgi:hypothetical protein